MDLNRWFSETEKWVPGHDFTKLRNRIECADGFNMSVQASRTHYCRPRDNQGPYEAVEVGFPSERVDEFMPYAERPEDPTGTVYAWVPIVVVEAVIAAHGGIKEPRCTTDA